MIIKIMKEPESKKKTREKRSKPKKRIGPRSVHVKVAAIHPHPHTCRMNSLEKMNDKTQTAREKEINGSSMKKGEDLRMEKEQQQPQVTTMIIVLAKVDVKRFNV